jgi:hypothetical protein
MNLKQILLPAAILLASSAWADLPPPDTSGCSGQQANASCETDDKKSGTCQTSKCSRLDYSQGTPPGTIEYDCLKCAASPASPGPSAPASTDTGKARAGCAAAPGVPLALAALLAGGLIRGKRRRA